MSEKTFLAQVQDAEIFKTLPPISPWKSIELSAFFLLLARDKHEEENPRFNCTYYVNLG